MPAASLGTSTRLSDRYAQFPSLAFDRENARILRIILDAPRFNAVGPQMHGELAGVWLTVDRDPDVRVAILQGAGKAFSAGGSFESLEAMITDYAMQARVMREARALVYNVINCSKPIVSAIHGPAVGAGLVAAVVADVSIAGRRGRRDAVRDRRRPRAGRCCDAVRHGRPSGGRRRLLAKRQSTFTGR
jgi:enoyl-CoA hydratase